jgi:hypothetical protein
MDRTNFEVDEATMSVVRRMFGMIAGAHRSRRYATRSTPNESLPLATPIGGIPSPCAASCKATCTGRTPLQNLGAS